MNKKELKKAFDSKLITEEVFKEKLFQLETAPKEKKKESKLRESITEEQFLQLIKSIPDKHKYLKVAFLLAFGAGLRIGEIMHLEKENIKENYIEIKAKENWHPKYGRERIVPKPKAWKSWMIDFLPIPKSNRTIQRMIKFYAKKSGLSDRIVNHSLRHGFATHGLESGIPINQVQLLLGHSNVSTTNSYIKANPMEALKKYEEVF